MSRNAIFEALFAKVSTGEGLPGVAGLSWPNGGACLWTSRRVRMFDNLPSKPALCQVEPSESITRVRGLPYKNTMTAEWWVFHDEGKIDSAVPTIQSNDIMDALEACLDAGRDFGTNRQTLGGLVYDAYFDGEVIKVPGDIVDEALICVPISILVP